MDSSPCADCAATLSLAARVVAGAASWMPRPNPPPRPSAPADGGAGPTVPVDDAAAAADENQLCARLGCGKSGAEQRCSRCKRTQYCGTDCQVSRKEHPALSSLAAPSAPKLHPPLAGAGCDAAAMVTRPAKHTEPGWLTYDTLLTRPCRTCPFARLQRTHWKVGGHKTLCTPIPQGGDVPTPAVPPQHLETYYRWLL